MYMTSETVNDTSAYYGGSGGGQFNMLCPGGYVTDLSGSYDGNIQTLQVSCSNNITPNPNTIAGKVKGINSINPGYLKCDEGYHGIQVVAGQFVNSITPVCGTTVYPLFGKPGGTKKLVTCGANKVITGIGGKAGDWIDSINIHCGDKPILTPTPTPTSTPTPTPSTPTPTPSPTTTPSPTPSPTPTPTPSPSPTPSPTPSPDSTSNPPLSTGETVGIMIGSFMCLVLIVVFFYWLYRRSKNKGNV
jgi:hypothetical protein